MKVDLQTLLPELKARLGAMYRERYCGVEIDRTSHLMASLSLEYGATLSCVFSSEYDWINLETAFLDNVREEAIAG